MRFRTRLQAELDRLEAAYRNTLTKAGVTIHDARAVLADAHTCGWPRARRSRAKHILIATGGRPFVPEFQGSDLAVTSNEIFHLADLPRRVAGGRRRLYRHANSPASCTGWGLQVAQYYRGAQILRGFDDEARGHVAMAMQDRGIDIRLRHRR